MIFYYQNNKNNPKHKLKFLTLKYKINRELK